MGGRPVRVRGPAQAACTPLYGIPAPTAVLPMRLGPCRCTAPRNPLKWTSRGTAARAKEPGKHHQDCGLVAVRNRICASIRS